MAEKRINPLLVGGVGIAGVCLTLAMCSQSQNSYSPMDALPTVNTEDKRPDGDTQTDTIKALQAYAKEAVSKADTLRESTENRLKQIAHNQQRVNALELENQSAQQTLADAKATIESLEQNLIDLQRQISESRQRPLNPDQQTPEGLPIGFGFDESQSIPTTPDQGNWFDPIDLVVEGEAGSEGNGFTGLLPQAPQSIQAVQPDTTEQSAGPTVTIEPIYTLPKDATLTDGLALTALIGRIPVEGQTPDPYPIKIYVGKENLLANGQRLPEVEGMIFSGLGIGDWNLSCVSARLMSATFIFEDGAIVTHSSDGQPLGYISDPSGIPCIAGEFVTNAPTFISQRIGLSALGAAGSAYAEAQQQRQSSSLTGNTTSTVVGDIHKLATGQAVESATAEVSRWLLARQKQSFDAVVVNPGAAVSIHLDQSLALDKNSLARRVRYEKDPQNTDYQLD
ncbi:TIGR03752 family integrating conjugative element protein [Porticoccus sp. GXU_MW_L64]